MKKFLIIIISIIILIVIIVLLNGYVASPDNVWLSNIQVDDSSVSFHYSERFFGPSLSPFDGNYLRSYKYEINDDGVLTVRFYLTSFRFFAKDRNIVIKASNVKRIDIQGKDGSTFTFWENGVSYKPEDPIYGGNVPWTD